VGLSLYDRGVKLQSATLGSAWLETRRRRGGATMTAAMLALLSLLISEVVLHHWSVGTFAIQTAVAVLFAVGVFVVSLVVEVRRLEAKLRTANRDNEVVQYRVGVHKGIAAVLEGCAASGDDDETRLRWLARRVIEVLRTDRFLSEEKIRQVEEIANDPSLSPAERLAKLEQHLRDRLIEGRYLLP
jgi:uncharacterized membrane protein YciS (DUF1049 family)